jgi:fructose-1,6-bisphosphatase
MFFKSQVKNHACIVNLFSMKISDCYGTQTMRKSTRDLPTLIWQSGASVKYLVSIIQTILCTTAVSHETFVWMIETMKYCVAYSFYHVGRLNKALKIMCVYYHLTDPTLSPRP